ncbi:hypothetical protein O6H91_19G085000 [Diphasiastrum complanatum]|uniref:Uncharacterized protein n=1 Tax=Diphasiastrum complanatum TaxID=34168 RepID=A0ACC2AYI7_DIPCM|nr:hypothetical protein O6H91_19G085000 [Diphasiastrum complanatum]
MNKVPEGLSQAYVSARPPPPPPAPIHPLSLRLLFCHFCPPGLRKCVLVRLPGAKACVLPLSPITVPTQQRSWIRVVTLSSMPQAQVGCNRIGILKVKGLVLQLFFFCRWTTYWHYLCTNVQC